MDASSSGLDAATISAITIAVVSAILAAVFGLVNLIASAVANYKFSMKLERIKPDTEAERYRRQAVWEQRFGAYYDSIDCITRYLQADDWKGPGIPEGRKPVGAMPTEAEVNLHYAKLTMYCNDPQIPVTFFERCQVTNRESLGKFVAMLRADLGLAPVSFGDEGYRYYFRLSSEGEPKDR